MAGRRAILFSGVVSLVAAAAAHSQTPSRFDAEVLSSKSAMMAQPHEAYDHAEAALTAARLLAPGPDRDLRAATAQWLKAEALTRLKQPAQAMPLLDQALDTVARVQPKGKLRGDVLKSHGRAAAANGRVQTALKDFQDAYAIYQAVGEARSEAIVLQEIGEIYLNARDYDHVLQYYAQSRETYSQDPSLTLAADNNRAFALKDLDRLPEAEAEFRKALDAAVHMQSAYLQAEILTNLAYTEAQQGKMQAARRDVNLGLSLVRKSAEAKTERPFLLGVLAKIAAQNNDLEKAVKLLDEMFAGVDSQASTVAYRDFHELAARVYETVGQPEKALEHLHAFKRIDDETRSLASSTNAALMAAKFDFAAQSTKIAELRAGQLKRDVLLARSKARLTATVTVLLLIGGAIFSGLMLSAFLAMRRSRNRIRSINAELETANSELGRALRAKTEFLATTSHEIRTPLNGILGMTQVMLADQKAPAQLRDRLGVIKSAGETMSALVNDLLDMAKIETGNLTLQRGEINLVALLKDAARMWADQARTKGLEFKLDLSECPEHVVEDGDRLRQILFNLMSNASKFTPAGSIGLSARARPAAGGERILFEVTDTGIGIAEADQARIFESFTQADGSTARKYGGTGLGLTICRRLAIAMDGQITVRSALGEGSSFCVDLPLTRYAPVEASPGRPPGQGKPLLIVEDNPLAQSMLRAVLQDAFKSIEFAGSLQAAADALDNGAYQHLLIDGGCVQRAGTGDPVDAVASFVQGQEISVSLLWPAPTPEICARLATIDVDQIIAKPIAPGALLELVRRWNETVLEDGCSAVQPVGAFG